MAEQARRPRHEAPAHVTLIRARVIVRVRNNIAELNIKVAKQFSRRSDDCVLGIVTFHGKISVRVGSVVDHHLSLHIFLRGTFLPCWGAALAG